MGAALWAVVWKVFMYPILSLIVGGLVLGLLAVSSILFTTLGRRKEPSSRKRFVSELIITCAFLPGNEVIFRNDQNYWMVVGCGCLVVPIILTPFGILVSGREFISLRISIN